MITSAYSQSSNSSGFNPILQKFYEMICEIIVSQKVCRISLFFLSIEFYLLFYGEEQFFGTIKSLKVKYLKTHLFQKISAHHFWKLYLPNWAGQIFFLKNIFFKDLELFSWLKNHKFGCHFFPQKLILYFFSKVII